MATLNELKLAALQTLTGKTGTINELEFDWLGGVLGDTMNGLWLAFLAVEGFNTGIRNQDEWGYYESLGHLGTLNEKRYQFWEAGGPPVQAGTVMPDMSLTTGRMGQDHGYLRGSYGSVTPDETTDNFEIRRLTVRNNTGLVTFRVEGNHPQDDFTSMEIVSIGTVLTAAAASYNFDGTDSIWTWNTAFSLVDTTVYAVEFL